MYVSQSILENIFSTELINTFLVLVVMLCCAGTLVFALEGGANRALNTPLQGVYWAVSTLSTVGYGDVVLRSRAGRVLATVWMVASLISLCVLTSQLSARVTASGLQARVINALADVTGVLCVESFYPELADFVRLDPQRPPATRTAEVGVCIAELLAGNVQAVISDRPLLSWYVDAYNVDGLHISPPLSFNPFAFAWPSGQQWGPRLNPAILRTTRSATWAPRMDNIRSLYFGVQQRAAHVAPAQTAVRTELKLAAGLVFAATLALSALPGLPCVRRGALARRMPSWVVRCWRRQLPYRDEKAARKAAPCGAADVQQQEPGLLTSAAVPAEP